MNQDLSGCFVVTFYSKLKGESNQYRAMSKRMFDLALNQSGYLGIETVRNAQGVGITNSYWKTLKDIKAWKANADHQIAQAFGIEKGYQWYHISVSQIIYNHSSSQNFYD